jgi:hypothetical protein
LFNCEPVADDEGDEITDVELIGVRDNGGEIGELVLDDDDTVEEIDEASLN